jgi:acyl-coenzyme A thioesterase PaaI-like protein
VLEKVLSFLKKQWAALCLAAVLLYLMMRKRSVVDFSAPIKEDVDDLQEVSETERETRTTKVAEIEVKVEAAETQAVETVRDLPVHTVGDWRKL